MKTTESQSKDQKKELLLHESILLNRWRNGDSEAFDILIGENLAVVQRLALRMMKDETLANDVVADVMLRAFRSAKNFSGASMFKTWLHRIVVNCALDAKRARRINYVSLDEIHSNEESSHIQLQLAEGGPTALDRVLADEQLKWLKHSVEKLDAPERRLILLVEDGRGYRDIANKESIPIGTVKSRLYRARDTMKRDMRRQELLAPQKAS